MSLGSKTPRPPRGPRPGPGDPEYIPVQDADLEDWEERELFRTLKLMGKCFAFMGHVITEGVKGVKALQDLKKHPPKQIKEGKK